MQNSLIQDNSEMIFDASMADFEEKVIKASLEKPVIADFWAPWCEPCKQLTPVLEKLVQEAGGAVALAKVNMDENQQLAAALQIQSVPAVFAFFGGRPVDAFQGALPESQAKAFIDKLVQVARASAPEAIDIPETHKAAAESLAAGDLSTAQALYTQILAQDENNAPAYAGIVRVLLAGGYAEEAASMIDNAPDEIAKAPAFNEARTAVELAQGGVFGDMAALEAAVEKKPADYQARYDLALAQFAAGAKEQAIDNLIAIIEAKRDWNDDAARLQLLKFFEALGFSDPLAIEGRKKLSWILFS